MGALIFILIIVCWTVALGRTMGGNGKWYPTGGQPVSAPVSPSPVREEA